MMMNEKDEIWFPESSQHFSRRLAAIRKILPLPLEQVMAPDLLSLSALAEKIQKAVCSAEVIHLATGLTSRELDLVFPLLATLDPDSQSDSPMIGRLNLIIRERACPSLYARGWLAFQKAYPSREIGRSLNILCKIIEIKHPVLLPGQLPLPLISEIAPPNTRHLVKRLIDHLETAQMALSSLMARYQIETDLPLGAELIAQTFINGNASIYQDGQQLFGQALKQASLSTQVALLHHFLGLNDLQPGLHNRFCQQIYRCFGEPDENHPVWSQMRAKDRETFRDWVFAATIGSHCRQLPPKARLYQRYADQIVRLERWDDDTLLIYFDRFLIADSRQNPLLAICYNLQADSRKHPFDLANQEFSPNPADPAIPRRQVDDAIRTGNFEGIIGLPFDPEGIRVTSTFLGLALRAKSRNPLSRIHFPGR